MREEWVILVKSTARRHFLPHSCVYVCLGVGVFVALQYKYNLHIDGVYSYKQILCNRDTVIWRDIEIICLMLVQLIHVHSDILH